MGVDDEERRLRSGRCVAVFRDCLGFVGGSTYHHSLYGDDIEAECKHSRIDERRGIWDRINNKRGSNLP